MKRKNSLFGLFKGVSVAGRGLICLLLVSSLLVGCGGLGSTKSSSMEAGYDSNQDNGSGAFRLQNSNDGEEAYSEDIDIAATEDSGAAQTGKTDRKADSGQSEYGQKLIYTYYFDFDTTEYQKSVDYINQALKKYEGYMESCSESGTESHYASMVLRIPAKNIDAFLAETGNIGIVRSKEVTSEDVTLDYFDTKAHLETLETQRKRLLELLEKAKSVSDITKIQGQLTDVEYEINSYNMQLKVYDNRVDYVTLNLSLNEVAVNEPTEEDGFLARVKKGLSGNTSDVMDGLVEFTIWFLIMIPYFFVLAIVAILIVLIVKKVKKGKAKDWKGISRREKRKADQKTGDEEV